MPSGDSLYIPAEDKIDPNAYIFEWSKYPRVPAFPEPHVNQLHPQEDVLQTNAETCVDEFFS